MNQKIEKVKKETSPKRKVFFNFIMAFIIGGIICIIGELFTMLFIKLKVEKDIANIYSVIVMVFLGSLTTGLGLYDKLGQIAGCGTIIPITGFANSIVSPAMEYKSEGYVMGVGAKMFTVAGPVLVYGISTSVIVGLCYLLFNAQTITLV